MATQRFKVFKETGVPGAWVNNALYFIKDPLNTYVEVYITSSVGVPQRMINEDDIQTLINSTISSSNEVVVVDTIAARNALALTRTSSVFVKNATGDATVTSGGAFYLWDNIGQVWIKTAESESMDVTLSWANISGKPSSSASAIDNAVSASHSHTNKTQLDKIGEDGDGNVTYNGGIVSNALETANW
jgi:hypothetical protein